MRTRTPRSKLTLLFMAFAMVLALPATAFADQVTNTLDTDIDSTYEVMAVDKGKTNTTQLYVNSTNGDGKSGCNITGNDRSVTVSLRSSDTSVATVSPSSVTFDNCVDKKLVTVSGVAQGSALITASLTENTSEGSVTVTGVDFRVNVIDPPPANTAPTVSVDGVEGGKTYEKGSVPAATCSVVDAEDGNKSFPAALSGTLDANGYGSQTATCSYTDAGGVNASASKTYSIAETNAPSSQHALSDPANANDWHKQNVTVTLTAEDNEGGSGVKEIRYSINNAAEQTAAGSSKAILVDSEGTTSISYYAVDNFNNAEGPANSATVKLDKTAPVISGADVNDTTWRNSNLSQSFTASDATSGLSNGADASFSLTASLESANANAPTTDSKTVTDAAGNSATRSLSALIDKTAPVITNNGPTTGANNNGWYNSNVTNTFSASDALSGLANAADASISKDTQGEGRALTVASGNVADLAGNVAPSVDSRSFNVDKTAPTNVAGTPDRAANAAGWYNRAVTVSFAGDDALSGIANCSSNTYSGPDSASASVGGSCRDLAGNSANGSFGLEYDATAPTLAPSVSPNPVLINGNATATSGAQDNLSDLASQGCDPVNTGSVGAKSVSCSATDNAGNSTARSASYNVHYDFAGFFRPIDNKDASGNYIVNVAKAGSTIPVKFSLVGDQGLNIFSVSPSSGSLACDAAATTDTLEEYSTATTSGLKYDALAGQYVYNWKTASTFAGSCRQLVVKFQDGTVQRASFKFTK